MDGDDGVEWVGLAGEHSFGFKCFRKIDEGGDLAGEVGLGVLTFLGELKVGVDVVGAAGEVGFIGEQGFDALAFAHERL